MAGFFIGDVVFVAALDFLAGLSAANFPWPLGTAAAILAAVSLLVFRFAARRTFAAACMAAGFMLLPFLFGAYYLHFFINLRNAGERMPEGKASFRVLAENEPAVSETYASFSGELQPPYSGTVTMFVPAGSALHYGDLVAATGTVSAPRRIGDPPAVFPKDFAVVSRGGGSSLVRAAIAVRTAVSAKFGAWLPGDAAGLLEGMFIGGTADLDPSLRKDMAASETLYIASLYGYKIGMIILCTEIFLADWVPRAVRSVLAAAFGFAVVLLSGESIAAVRAGLAAAMLLFARHAGVAYAPRHALALTAAALAAADPAAVTGPAFSLTFLSVAGMVFLPVPVRNFLHLGSGRGFLEWKEAVAVSLASLLPIVPSVAALSGSFSLAAVPANILLAPAVPVGMILGAALAAIPAAVPAGAFLVSRAAGAFLGYPLFVIRFFAAHAVPLPFSFSSASSWMLYFAALALFFFVYRDRPAPGRVVPPHEPSG